MGWNSVHYCGPHAAQTTPTTSQSTWLTQSQQVAGNAQQHCIRLLILLLVGNCRTVCACHLAARLASASCQPPGKSRLLPGQLLLQRNNV